MIRSTIIRPLKLSGLDLTRGANTHKIHIYHDWPPNKAYSLKRQRLVASGSMYSFSALKNGTPEK